MRTEKFIGRCHQKIATQSFYVNQAVGCVVNRIHVKFCANLMSCITHLANRMNGSTCIGGKANRDEFRFGAEQSKIRILVEGTVFDV